MNDKLSYEELQNKISGLENQANQLQGIIEATEDFAFVITDLKGIDTKILGFSRGAEKAFGYTAKEIIGQRVATLHPPGVEQDFPSLQEALEIGKSQNKTEINLVRKSGEVFPALFSLYPYHDHEGQLIGTIGVTIDVTDQRKVENSLRFERLRLQSIFNAAPTGIGLVVNRVITYVNQDFVNMIGRSEEELLGQGSRILYDSDEEFERVGLVKYQAIGKKGVGSVETQFVRKDGTKIDVLLSSSPIDQDDLTVGVTFTALDITDRKQAEAALRESEDKYRSMMETMLDPVYIVSSDLRLEYVNPAMTTRLKRDATGEACYKAIHGLDEKCSWCVIDKIKQGLTHIEDVKSPLDERHYHVTATPIYHQSEAPSMMTIFRDMTEFLAAVAENESIQIQLLQAQKMQSIGTLAGGIAHDFNNILASIFGYTELALDDVAKGSELEDDLREIHTAANRAKALVKQILTFARQTETELKPIQVGLIIKEGLKFLRSSLPSTIDIKDKVFSHSIVSADVTQVHQIIMNLCTNAAQAMEEQGGTLEVSLKDVNFSSQNSIPISGLGEGDYVELTVSDTGYGMPAEVQEHIFEPYFTTKSAGKGTGMGLAIVNSIVEESGGKIVVNSSEGRGTQFTVLLPHYKGPEVSVVNPENVLPRGHEHVLIVDDEISIINVTQKVLLQLGYRVTSSTDSVQALELFQKAPHDFDLVFTDMTMPHMTGIDLAEEMVALRPDLPVILCTGYSKDVGQKVSQSQAIRELTYKPVLKADLAQVIRSVLDGTKTAAEKPDTKPT